MENVSYYIDKFMDIVFIHDVKQGSVMGYKIDTPYVFAQGKTRDEVILKIKKYNEKKS
jgi:predicted RNase H-like HicB family nuclease